MRCVYINPYVVCAYSTGADTQVLADACARTREIEAVGVRIHTHNGEERRRRGARGHKAARGGTREKGKVKSRGTACQEAAKGGGGVSSWGTRGEERPERV